MEKGKGVDGGKDVFDGSVKEDLVNVPTAEEVNFFFQVNDHKYSECVHMNFCLCVLLRWGV